MKENERRDATNVYVPPAVVRYGAVAKVTQENTKRMSMTPLKEVQLEASNDKQF